MEWPTSGGSGTMRECQGVGPPPIPELKGEKDDNGGVVQQWQQASCHCPPSSSRCSHNKHPRPSEGGSSEMSSEGPCVRDALVIQRETIDHHDLDKTKQRGATSDKKVINCQVCGDFAAGFYCSAFICEACRKFFIRSTKQSNSEYVCQYQKRCEITKENRMHCQFCRYKKCLELNMTNEKKEEKNKSPFKEVPCRVCSAPSSGCHFGVLTCEGCKGFFRRTVKDKSQLKYTCLQHGDCEISTSKTCKFCRYKKCLDVGMAVTASRRGRQPNAVKHVISLEVKKQLALRETQKVEEQSVPTHNNDHEDTMDDTAMTQQIVKKGSTGASLVQQVSWTNMESDNDNRFTKAPQDDEIGGDMGQQSNHEANMDSIKNSDDSWEVNNMPPKDVTVRELPLISSRSQFHSSVLNDLQPSSPTFANNFVTSVRQRLPNEQCCSLLRKGCMNFESAHFVNDDNDSYNNKRDEDSMNLVQNHYFPRHEYPDYKFSHSRTDPLFLSPSTLNSDAKQPLLRCNVVFSQYDYYTSEMGFLLRNGNLNSYDTYNSRGVDGNTGSSKSFTPIAWSGAGKKATKYQHSLYDCPRKYSDEGDHTKPAGHYHRYRHYSREGDNNYNHRRLPDQSYNSYDRQWKRELDYSISKQNNCLSSSEDSGHDMESDTLMRSSGPPQELDDSIFTIPPHLSRLSFMSSLRLGENYTTVHIQMMLNRAAKELTHMCNSERVKSGVFDEESFSSMNKTWERMMRHFEFHAKCVVRFVKRMPGFRDLSVKDQIRLLQRNSYPLVVLNQGRTYEPDTGFVNYLNLTEKEAQKMQEYFPEFSCLRSHYLFSGHMAMCLQMTDLEYAHLSCLLVLSDDTHVVLDAEDDKVAELREFYTKYLYDSEDPIRFTEMMRHILEFNYFSHRHDIAVEKVLRNHHQLTIPALFSEMYQQG